MDSQAPADGYLLEIVDSAWREEVLPYDPIVVPIDKLPDPESDGGDCTLTLFEQDQKWSDLAISSLAPDSNLNDQNNTATN